jgi:predicted nucleic acid-binding protein
LSTFPHLDWQAATLEICDRAAALRSAFNLRTPDALQVATAIHSGADAFVSNDPVFGRIPDLDVLILDDLSGE